MSGQRENNGRAQRFAVTVDLGAELHAAVSAHAERAGVTVTAVVREVVRQFYGGQTEQDRIRAVAVDFGAGESR